MNKCEWENKNHHFMVRLSIWNNRDLEVAHRSYNNCAKAAHFSMLLVILWAISIWISSNRMETQSNRPWARSESQCKWYRDWNTLNWIQYIWNEIRFTNAFSLALALILHTKLPFSKYRVIDSIRIEISIAIKIIWMQNAFIVFTIRRWSCRMHSSTNTT